MMGTALDFHCVDTSANIILDAASKPWIEISIREDDVCVLSVLLGVIMLSTKLLHGPVVIWSQIEFSLAVLGVGSCVEEVILSDED